MEKPKEDVIKCSQCTKTWPRFVRNKKGKIIAGPGEAMAKLQWHFQTKHSYAYSKLQVSGNEA